MGKIRQVITKGLSILMLTAMVYHLHQRQRRVELFRILCKAHE